MQPFGAVERLKETYLRFVETSFPLTDLTLQQKFRDLVNDEHLLRQDPFVSLSRLFKSGETLTNLVEAGKLSAPIQTGYTPQSPHWAFTRLRAHQYQATLRLSSFNRDRYRQ